MEKEEIKFYQKTIEDKIKKCLDKIILKLDGKNIEFDIDELLDEYKILLGQRFAINYILGNND